MNANARLQAIRNRLGGDTFGNMLAVAGNPWRARWQSLDARVRRIATIGLALLALAMLWAYVWLPAARGRVQLAERIPAMSAQLAAMRGQAEEIKRLNAMPPVASTRAILPLADVGALQVLFGGNAKVSLDENRAFRIVIPAVAYTAWLDQLDSALSRYRLRVAAVTLKPLAAGASRPAAKSAEVAVDLSLVDDTGNDRDRRP